MLISHLAIFSSNTVYHLWLARRAWWITIRCTDELASLIYASVTYHLGYSKILHIGMKLSAKGKLQIVQM